MLSLFLSRSLAAKITFSKPTYKDSLFNMMYADDNNKNHDLIWDNRGVFVGFRIYDENGKPGQINILKDSMLNNGEYIHTVSDFETIKFKLSFKTASSKSPINVPKITVKNDGFYARKIDLGFFIDCNFQDGVDNGPIRKIDGNVEYNRGLRVNASNRYIYSLLFKNSKLTPYPDNVYVGDLKRSTSTDPTFYPFFQNGVAQRTSSNSVIAFSWTNHTLVANGQIDFQFAVIASGKVDTPPLIIDRNEYKPNDQYKPGEKISFKFDIVGYDVGDEISINFVIADQYDDMSYTKTATFTPTEETRSITFTYDDYVIPEIGFYFILKATDKARQSSVVDKNIIPVTKPKFTSFQIGPKKEYYIQEKIPVSGSGKVPFAAKVNYQIRNGPVITVGEINSETTDFTGEITIPPVLKKRENYTIRIWIEILEVKSEIQEFTFYLRDQESPEFLSLASSDYAYVRGKTELVIIGEAHDQEEMQLLSIFHKLDKLEKNRLELGKLTNLPQIKPFAFYLEMPSQISSGLHDIEFDIMDDTNLHGKTNRTVSIRVCDEGEACYEPGEEPTIQPSSNASNAGNQEDQNPDEKYKSRMPIVWVLTIFNIIAVIVLLVIGVFYIRKKMIHYDAFKDDTTTSGEDEISESNITPSPGTASKTIDNPLFSSGIPQSDDVFANDYHEETTVDVFKFNNDEDDPDLGI